MAIVFKSLFLLDYFKNMNYKVNVLKEYSVYYYCNVSVVRRLSHAELKIDNTPF